MREKIVQIIKKQFQLVNISPLTEKVERKDLISSWKKYTFNDEVIIKLLEDETSLLKKAINQMKLLVITTNISFNRHSEIVNNILKCLLDNNDILLLILNTIDSAMKDCSVDEIIEQSFRFIVSIPWELELKEI